MKERTRALKRHHDARIKDKRTRYVNQSLDATLTPQMPSDRAIGRIACTPASCSCFMCGNPRTHNGELTLKEKSALEIEKSTCQFKDNSDTFNYRNTEPYMWQEAEKEVSLI